MWANLASGITPKKRKQIANISENDKEKADKMYCESTSEFTQDDYFRACTNTSNKRLHQKGGSSIKRRRVGGSVS